MKIMYDFFILIFCWPMLQNFPSHQNFAERIELGYISGWDLVLDVLASAVHILKLERYRED